MKSFPRSLLFALALSAPIISASAQNKVADTPVPLPATPPLVTSGLRGEQFILGPDDVISLTVTNHPEMSADSLTLSSTGRVALPELGPLTIRGKTLEQARRAIAAAYKSQLRDPKISITLVRARPRQATILGAVTRPGAVDLQPGWRVSEVLANVGDLNALKPDEVTATLKSIGKAPVPLDIATIYRAPENKANPRVTVGDVISVVPIPLVNVTVNGDVGTPGAQSFRRAPRLLEALGKAGDLSLAPANTDIQLLRAGKIIPLDVAAAADDPAGASNIELRDGDLLSVQGVRLDINVLSDEGLVKAPGNYKLEGRSSFYRAISAAGGPSVPASQISATVRRGNEIIPVDLARAVYDSKADIPLQNGDIIVLNPVEGPRVRLTGEIKAPKQYSFKPGTKVLDAVLQAGGLNGAPEATRISVLRTLPDGRQVPFQVDAGRLWGGNDVSQNLELKDGDVVLVNAIATRSVAVLGEVTTPGTYEMRAGDGLTEALLKAGGPGELADLSRVTIDRRGQTIEVVDYSEFGKGQVRDIKLEDGDNVRVLTNPRQVLLMDAFAKPGPYAIAEGTTLTLGEAIIRAGGTLPSARTNDITLLRRVPVTEKTPQGYEISRIKYNNASKGKLDETIYLPLQPGDVVLVPQGKDGPSKVSQGIQALGLFNLVRGFGF